MPTTTFRLDEIQAQFTANGFITYDQLTPDVTALDNGGFAVIYENDNDVNAANDFPTIDFYDASFNNIASAVEPWDDSDIYMESPPRIATLANGNVVAVWKEGSDGDDDILAQILSPTGAYIGLPFSVSGNSSDSFPDVDGLTSEDFVIVNDDDAPSNAEVFTQVFDDSGAGTGQVDDDISGVSLDARVAGLADGGFVVTFTNTDPARNGGEAQIVGWIFDGDGTERVSEFVIGTSGVNKKSSVTALPNGNWAVVYADSGYLDGEGISLHVYDPNGVEITSNAVRVDTQLNDIESNPDVTVLDNNFILVTFTDPSNSGDIHARLFSANGVPQIVNGGSDFIITSSGSADTFSSVAALNGAGSDFITVWQDSFSDGDGGQISGEVNRIVRVVVGDDIAELLIGDDIVDEISGRGGDDEIQGRGGADLLTGGNGSDKILGGDGDDRIFGQVGNDDLRGNNGDDTISGGDGDDTLSGNIGSDELFGSGGNDTIWGGDDADLIVGNADQDSLLGQGGDDEILGGTGDDYIEGNDGSDLLNGNAGNDTVIGELGDDTINGGDDADDLSGGVGNDSLSGNLASDTLDGADGDDFLNGGNGTDLVEGDAGADTIFGGINDDTLYGGDGKDQIASGDGNDFIDGEGGSDLIFAGANNDTVFGSAGNDTITGNAGNDVINGGAGTDSLIGGDGDDIFDYNPGDYRDSIAGFTTGAGSVDQIDLVGFGSAFDTFGEVIAVASQVGADIQIDFGAGDLLTLQNRTLGDLHADDFIFS